MADQADIDALVALISELEDELRARQAEDDVIFARRLQVVSNLRGIARAIEEGRDDEDGTLVSRLDEERAELADLRQRSAALGTVEISGRLQLARNQLRAALDEQPYMKRAGGV